MISTPCWPGNEFTYFKQFRVNTRNINDENTLRDPSHKGSCITTRSVCEGTGPASQTREGPHGVQIWPMIEGGAGQRSAPHTAGLLPNSHSKSSSAEEGFWSVGNVLFLGLGSGYVGVFGL